MKKYGGYIYEPLRPKDWVFGGITGLPTETLVEDRNWKPWLPEQELQINKWMDSRACVTYSALNCLETLIRRKSNGTEKYNFSDRFTAKMSGTTMIGNSFHNVAESIRALDGTVEELKWPFPSTMLVEEYYAEIPQDIKEMGKEFLKFEAVQYEYIPTSPDALYDALLRSPIQVGIYAYGAYDAVTDTFMRSEKAGNHAVTLYGAEKEKYWFIYDHYINVHKKLAWDTLFWGALRYDIKIPLTLPNLMKFAENTLYQLVEPPGGFYLYVAGKLRKDDLDKILASWLVRNNGDTKGKVAVLTNKDLEGVEIFNLKGNSVP
jgi:hypothetical protein